MVAERPTAVVHNVKATANGRLPGVGPWQLTTVRHGGSISYRRGPQQEVLTAVADGGCHPYIKGDDGRRPTPCRRPLFPIALLFLR
jgi:hypothetical protein